MKIIIIKSCLDYPHMDIRNPEDGGGELWCGDRHLVGKMKDKYILHSRGKDWFHFRKDLKSAMESFSVTYCHDGTVCMTGDMGCLVWQREYFPETLDYGFPFDETGVGYFAEKITRADTLQNIRSWSRALATKEIADAIREDRDAEDREALEYVYDDLSGLESGEYGYFQMLEKFNDVVHHLECEEYCEFGRDYSELFKTRFEMLKSVSNLILESVATDRR